MNHQVSFTKALSRIPLIRALKLSLLILKPGRHRRNWLAIETTTELEEGRCVEAGGAGDTKDGSLW